MEWEDRDVIGPAVGALRRDGLDVTGPQAADTLFHAAARQKYDAAIAMYHDQALIPIKTLAFDEGVNVTLGLAIRADITRSRNGIRDRGQRHSPSAASSHRGVEARGTTLAHAGFARPRHEPDRRT